MEQFGFDSFDMPTDDSLNFSLPRTNSDTAVASDGLRSRGKPIRSMSNAGKDENPSTGGGGGHSEDEAHYDVPRRSRRNSVAEALHHASDNAQKVARRVWEATHLNHLPHWLNDNEFLHTSHRPQIESFKECFKSIFSMHTETGNIWTHLIGCIVFIWFAFQFFLLHEKFPADEKWAFAVFFFGVIVCMACSSLFHTLACHSEEVGLLFMKIDYCGISLLTLGSVVPWLHFGFYCQEYAKAIYIGVITVLAVSCIAISLMDQFSRPEFRVFRAGLFAVLGFSTLIPTIHQILANGWTRSVEEAGLYWLFLTAFLYVLAGLAYACRFPERWLPGRCDIWFHSHQIFHIFVVMAVLVHYHMVSTMATYRLNHGACPVVATDGHVWNGTAS